MSLSGPKSSREIGPEDGQLINTVLSAEIFDQVIRNNRARLAHGIPPALFRPLEHSDVLENILF